MSPSKHRHRPLSFRPREDSDRVWLYEYAKATGQSVNSVLAEMLAAYRVAVEASRSAGG
jgi:hypothetical protein